MVCHGTMVGGSAGGSVVCFSLSPPPAASVLHRVIRRDSVETTQCAADRCKDILRPLFAQSKRLSKLCWLAVLRTLGSEPVFNVIKFLTFRDDV